MKLEKKVKNFFTMEIRSLVVRKRTDLSQVLLITIFNFIILKEFRVVSEMCESFKIFIIFTFSYLSQSYANF